MMSPHDPFRLIAGKPPPEVDPFELRVRMADEVAEALLAHRLPEHGAGLYIGGAFRTWFELGGDLQDYLQLRGPQGSTRTAPRVWMRIHSSSRRRTNGV